MTKVKSNHKQEEMSEKMPFSWAFLQPKYWGIWLILFLLLPLIWLPLPIQFWLGRGLGRLIFALGRRRRQDTLTNLALAYPAMPQNVRHDLARQVFMSQGIGIFETLLGWYRPQVFYKRFSIQGRQHITHAQLANKAVVLLGMHTTLLDLGGRLCTQFFAVDCIYRPQNNPLLEWLIFNARRRLFERQIDHKNMRLLATRLKQGKCIWYTPDQDFGLGAGVMAPFFGVNAATITAWRRFGKLAKDNPPVFLLLSFARVNGNALPLDKKPRYTITLAPLDLPSDDEYADATTLNALIACAINKHPEQWMWFHRRFKTQPDGKNFYQK